MQCLKRRPCVNSKKMSTIWELREQEQEIWKNLGLILDNENIACNSNFAAEEVDIDEVKKVIHDLKHI